MQDRGKVKIYDDGQCPFCQWAQGLVSRFDSQHRLDFRDYHQPGVVAETSFSLEQLHYRMHVLTSDGRWHAGYDGWTAILYALPRWRWLGRLMRLGPLKWLGAGVYRFVANHRYQVPRFVLRLIGAPTPCPPAGCTPRES